jgi:4-amino-4-deoxy-L-arabinose transferase-like glycosyltransferase
MMRIVRHPATWIVLGVVVVVALRAPWFGAALGRDEGGDALVALAWHHSGPFAYGPYFLDRPPLLVALYRLAAGSGGPVGLRVLGAVAAAGGVVLITLLAVRLAGRRAAPVAALVAAALLSSLAIDAVYTPAELLAIVPSTGSMLCLVAGLDRPEEGRRWLLAAGLLAGLALMVKQSFGDALAAGVVGLVVASFHGLVPGRRLLARAGAYAAGAGLVVAALVIWEQLARTPDESVYYAIIGFRLDAAASLTSSGFGAHLSRLITPALGSGLAVGLVLAAAGILTLRRRPGVGAALGTWLVVGAVGVLLGGSYWPHYLIELVPVTAIGTAMLFARLPRSGALAAAAVALPALFVTVGGIRHEDPERYQASAMAVGQYVHARARPNDTAYVMYARVNALYYTGLRSPFPYEWSLMMRSVPGAQKRLRALLASPQRPTWVVVWDRSHSLGLDGNHRTARLLHLHYRPAGKVCGRTVLLARGAGPRRAPGPAARCVVNT